MVRTAAWVVAGVLGGLAALALPGGVARAQDATVTMSADRTLVRVGEHFVVQIRADIRGAPLERLTPPDFTDFQVVAHQSSQPMQFHFGFGAQVQMVQSVNVETYELVALRPGTYTLRPAEVVVGGRRRRSSRLELRVLPGDATPPDPGQPVVVQPGNPGTSAQDPGAPPDVTAPPPAPSEIAEGAQYDPQAFLRTVVDEAHPFVGQQTTITIYLYTRMPIRSAPMATREASTDGFWVHDLLPPQRSLDATQQVVGGVPFRVYVMRRIAAFPLQPGPLTVGAMRMTLETGGVFDLFAQAPAPLEREGVPVSVTVLPLPTEGRPAGPVVVGRDVQLQAAVDREQAITGDAVSLTVTVRASANLRELRLDAPRVDGLRVLPPEIRDAVETPGDIVGGSRTFTWLLVPERPGTYTVPPLGVAAFDPRSKTWSRVESQPLTITAAGIAQTPVADTPDPREAPANTADPAEPEEPGGARLGPVRTQSALRRAEPPVSSSAWYPWAVGAPALLWLFVLAGTALVARMRSQKDAGAADRAVRGAKKRLAKAQTHAAAGDARAFYADVAGTLHAVLEARLGESLRGLTHLKLRHELEARGMDSDLVKRVVDEIEGSEFARFSATGAEPSEMQACRARVEALLGRLDRFSPRAEDAS